MPLVQYFAWVGSFLLAALLALGWCFPVAVHTSSFDVPMDEKIAIRIHSDQKWPERIQFDTAGPAMGAAATAGSSDVAPLQTRPELGGQGSFGAFAEMTADLVRPCFRPPCATRADKSARPQGGTDTSRRRLSRVATAVRKALTNPPHKRPGRS